MAIAHLRATVIGSGRSPVASAAYRHRATMWDGAADAIVSFAHKTDLAHEEIAVPVDAPAWLRAMIEGRTIAQASEALWNTVVDRERHPQAQFARELEMSLPKELDREQQIALVRAFAREQFTENGMVADWVLHAPEGNPHIHLMHTLRPLTEAGFGNKRLPVLSEDGEPIRVGGKIVYKHFAGYKESLVPLRLAWGNLVNQHLSLAGIDRRIDMRSYEDQGIAITPTTHIGPRPHAMNRGHPEVTVYSAHDHAVSRTKAARDILRDPSRLLVKMSRERSTFSMHDIAKELGRYIDDPAVFANTLVQIRASRDLVALRPDIWDPETKSIVAPAVFSTRELVRAEHVMAMAADRLAGRAGFAVSKLQMAAAIAKVEDKNPARRFGFDAEQVAAVRHVTSDAAISAVVGYAGAGKSTLLEAANLAWVADGRRVIGAALAGKAAEGLEASSGIASRTLASWELAWGQGRDALARGDILVVDEAGMVGSRQMARIVKAVESTGAKLVLVGDAMQLQPIEAGAAFRAITDRIGFAELIGIRRQKDEWAQAASRQFAKGNARDGLHAYKARGHVRQTVDRGDARDAIVADWAIARAEIAAYARTTGRAVRGDALLVLAHTNKDVFALNQGLREAMKAQGALTDARTIDTERGQREFAVGDRMIFLKNERFIEPAAPELGRQSVKNGQLGTVVATEGGLLRVDLDSGKAVAFRPSTYRNVDHGYAATIHKSQGVTVDRAFVLATPSFDQHLSYVALSRHRDQVTLYAGKSDFPTFDKLADTMGRSGAKTATLDFENEADYQKAARLFGARRGIDGLADIAPAFQQFIDRQKAWIADGSQRLTELWTRAETALGLAQARAAVPVHPALVPVAIEPKSLTTIVAMPGLLAVTDFDRSVAEAAREAFVSGAAWKHANQQLQPALARVYVDPAAALATITHATTQPGADPIKLANQIVKTPQAFGTVRPERTVMRDASELQVHIRVQVATFVREMPAATKHEEQRRMALAIPIPSMSEKAAEGLTTIEAARQAGGEEAARSATRLLLADKAASAEIKAVSDAVSQRFGRTAFGPKDDDQTRANVLDRLPTMDREQITALATTFTAVRAFGDALHHAERRAEVPEFVASTPLRPARIVPDLTPDEITTAILADKVGQDLRARVEQIAVAVYGNAKPLAEPLATIERTPKAAAEIAITLLDPTTITAPLAGKLGGMFGTKPDAVRQAAEAARPQLAPAVAAYGDHLTGQRTTLIRNHREIQTRLAVEIPAPSAPLAALLRSPDPEAITKLATNKDLAIELTKLNKVLEAGLSVAEHSAAARGQVAELSKQMTVPVAQAKRLAEVHTETRQLTTKLHQHQQLTKARTIVR